MGNPDYPAIERTLLEKRYLEVLSEEYLFIPTERTSLVKMTWDKESAFQSDFSVGQQSQTVGYFPLEMCIWSDSLNLLTLLLGITCFTCIPISQQMFLPSSLTGNRCDECPSGFYKNPGSPGHGCAPCPCNNNIDVTDPESCNRVTGECTKCLHNTHGAHCQFCKPGYFGSALNQDCQSK